MTFPEENRTWKILHEADKGGYAVPAFNWYVAFLTTNVFIQIANALVIMPME